LELGVSQRASLGKGKVLSECLKLALRKFEVIIIIIIIIKDITPKHEFESEHLKRVEVLLNLVHLEAFKTFS